MANSIRDEKITEFFQSVFKSHMDKEGNVSFGKLDRILTSLGRKISEERILKIMKKFKEDDNEMINWRDPDFIMTVASLNVVDVKAIEDAVFATAFRIFDMDSDGRISLHEMRIVLSLFLPVQIQQEQERVETTIFGMDTQKDGEIRYTDFVKGVRDSGTFKLSMYREEFLLASLMVVGFVLYQLFKEYGIVPVIGVYEGPMHV